MMSEEVLVSAGRYQDKRGVICDLMPFWIEEGINAVTFISSVKGSIRGNHYHKETTQWTYITKGQTRVVHIIDGTLCDSIFGPGELITHRPGVPHAFEAIEDTEWLVFAKGPRAGDNYELDTFRLEIPLI